MKSILLPEKRLPVNELLKQWQRRYRPENLVFDGEAYRTNRLNEAVRLIFKLREGFSELKNRKNSAKTRLSGLVVPGVSDSNLVMASMLEFSGK